MGKELARVKRVQLSGDGLYMDYGDEGCLWSGRRLIIV